MDAGVGEVSIASAAGGAGGGSGIGLGGWLSIIGIGAATASTAYMASQKPKIPALPADTGADNKAALEAAYAQADMMRKRAGGASTILTSPLGVQTPNTKTQLGG